MTPSASEIVCSSSRPPMKTAGEMSRMNLVTHSPTSVEPATIVAAGSACRAAPRNRRPRPARAAAALPSPISTRLPSRIAVKPGGDRLALDGKRVLRGLAVAGDRPRRAHDRLVAGAAAEIALQRLLDLGIRRLAATSSTARRATSRSPACRSRIASRGNRPSPAAPDAVRRPSPRRCSTVTTWQPSSEPRKRMQALTLS